MSPVFSNTFNLLVPLICALFVYWPLHYVSHTSVLEYNGLKGYLKYGVRLRWNLVAVYAIILVALILTDPRIQ